MTSPANTSENDAIKHSEPTKILPGYGTYVSDPKKEIARFHDVSLKFSEGVKSLEAKINGIGKHVTELLKKI